MLEREEAYHHKILDLLAHPSLKAHAPKIIPKPLMNQRIILAPLRCFLNKLGNPEKAMAPSFHITGTNGKGSTYAHVVAMLQALGYRVHGFSSPHLVHVQERVLLQGKIIQGELWYEALSQGLRNCQNWGITLSPFELLTGVAIDLFAQFPSDFCVFEVGLGGRWDATNVIARVAASLVATISLDHQAILGPGIREIAWEKSGIFRKDAPAVWSVQPEEALEVLKNEGRLHSQVCFPYGKSWEAAYPQNLTLWDQLKGPTHFSYRYQDRHYEGHGSSLLGRHQAMNSGLAITGLHSVPSIDFSWQKIQTGLSRVQWPGRMEIWDPATAFKGASLDPRWHWLMDGVHNLGGAQTLAENLGPRSQDRPVIMVYGMLARKKDRQFFKDIGAVCRLQLAWPDFSQGSMTMEDYQAVDPSIEMVHSFQELVCKVRQFQDNYPHRWSQGIVLLGGSLHFIGFLKRQWNLMEASSPVAF